MDRFLIFRSVPVAQINIRYKSNMHILGQNMIHALWIVCSNQYDSGLFQLRYEHEKAMEHTVGVSDAMYILARTSQVTTNRSFLYIPRDYIWAWQRGRISICLWPINESSDIKLEFRNLPELETFQRLSVYKSVSWRVFAKSEIEYVPTWVLADSIRQGRFVGRSPVRSVCAVFCAPSVVVPSLACWAASLLYRSPRLHILSIWSHHTHARHLQYATCVRFCELCL